MPSFLGFDYVTPLEIISNEPRFITESQNLRRFSSRTGAQRWEVRISFTTGKNTSGFSKLQSHYLQKGLETGFNISMPQHLYTNEPVVPVTFTPDTDYVAGVNTIGTDTFTSIDVGRFITFSNHTKVYMVVDTPTTSSIVISPPLVKAITDTDTINTATSTTENDSGVKLKVVYENTNESYTYTNGIMQQIKKQFIEDL